MVGSERVKLWQKRWRQRLGPRSPDRAVAFKAASFAAVGVINTLVDAALFFLIFRVLASSVAAEHLFMSFAANCRCATSANIALITANSLSWLIAASGSYAMNSYTTFAAESGRKLTRRAYAGFLASGLLGLVANTTTLVVVAQVLPVWAAKGCAILVSFVVNFSMSHFVVFRRRAATSER
jgi:putative flippase GtrA